MRLVSSSKCVNPIPLLHPTQTSFLLYSSVPHHLSCSCSFLPSPSSSISIRQQDIKARTHMTLLRNSISNIGCKFSIPMYSTACQQSSPNRFCGFHRHFLNHLNCILQFPSTAKQI